MFVDSPHIPPAYCYRCPFEKTYPECGLLCARFLDSAIAQQGPENVAAFIAEPVVGAALGAVPAPDGYFEIIREICDKHDVLFIADEVMTGWGRTGALWGIEHWEVTPDIIATAKGMTAGYTPLSAIIARDELWAVLEEKDSHFKAGHTLNASAVSCAGAIAVIRYTLDHGLPENARLRGEQAQRRLRLLQQKHPSVGDGRGRGLLFGFELVRDRRTADPFDPSLRIAARIETAAFRRGLVTYPCAGCIDGIKGDMVLMAPPLTITQKELDELFDILGDSIGEVEEEVGSEIVA
jgi:adenosylmethionine-8-amino-7-oxononanoate aminotransferase